MNWEKLRRKLVEEYYPEEKDFIKLENLYAKIDKYIKEEYSIKTHFAGSASRRTCLRKDRDIDLFLMFPEDTSSQELENKGLEIGKNVFKKFKGNFHVEYAEHPYVKGKINNTEVEIVPCIETDSKNIKSSVDRTPHHTRWVKKNLNKKQRQDAVLLKQFLKTKRIYGSSLKTKGFSGYLVEILVSHYGSLQKLIEKAQSWDPKTNIDPENHWNAKLPKKLEEKFENDSLVVIDPVDPERNVASVLSTENYSKFVHNSWCLNEKPGVNHFRNNSVEIDKFEIEKELSERGDIILIEFESPDKPEDIVYPQVRKMNRKLRKDLEKNGFPVTDIDFHADEKVRIIVNSSFEIPKKTHRKGPEVFHPKENVEEFTKKYERTFIEDKRLYAVVDRDYTELKTYLKHYFSRDQEKLREKGVPSNLASKVTPFRLRNPMIEENQWLKFLHRKYSM